MQARKLSMLLVTPVSMATLNLAMARLRANERPSDE